MQYSGLAITDHEILSAHVESIQVARKMKEEGTMPGDFKLILGNEIYLVDSLEEVKDNYQPGVTKFPHFLLLSKSLEGHRQLRILSSRAWSRSYNTGLMTRTPTLKSDLEEIIKPNQGHIIAGSACLGSEVNIRLLAIKEAMESNNNSEAQFHREKLNEFILWCIDVFGQDHFFIELQPALSWEQIHCNKELVKIAKFYDLKLIVTTDAHYLRPEDRDTHEAFLNAKDGEREVASFYEACFLQSIDEMYDRMDYLGEDIVTEAIKNTQLIGDMVEDYTIEHDTVIPRIELPKFELRHMFKPAYKKYGYIKKMAYSDDEQNRYLLKLIEDGFEKNLKSPNLTQKSFHEILARIDVELGELWEIGKVINQNMGSYYITVKEIVDVIWEQADSLVGSGRGSSSGFIINYLLGITQINPLEYGVEIPHWRHLHKSRADVSALDIDIDTEGSKRSQIINALKNHFGEDRVLQVSVFGTETSKAAIATACRGLGYDSDIALHLGGIIPFERGKNWSIHECLYGNEEKGREPVTEFINEIEKYPRLKETALGLNGLTSRRGIHAGGIILFNDPYFESNALMTAPNGTPVTQYNLDDSQALGNIKYDLLTVESLDKIRVALDLLIENDEIEPESTVRETFDKYLHPDVIDKDSKEVYDILSSDTVADVFQFSTDIARDAIIKVQPSNLIETAAVNSLMRLQASSGEQPIDTFVRYKNDIDLWYKEMQDYGLNDNEIKIMEGHLLVLSGISDTQENVMIMAQDKNIAGYTVQQANVLRKVIGGSPQEVVNEEKERFFSGGLALGTRKELLNYVWDVQIRRQLNYSFSICHVIPYTLMALQEINLNLHYDPIYWQTACLTVNSGAIESNEETQSNTQNTNYGKVASAISEIQYRNIKVTPPDINDAGFSFTPDIKNSSIFYGLKGLVGVGDETISTIISNRPYTSFSDFLARLFDTKLVQNTHVLQLIKAGAFDSFGDRLEIMQYYLEHRFTPRKQITLASVGTLSELNAIPSEYDLLVRFYNFRKYISQKQNIYGKSDQRKTKNNLYLIDDISLDFLLEHFSEDCIVDYHEGQPIVAEWLFDNEYDKKMQPLKEWMALDSTLEEVNKLEIQQEWEKDASGTISEWEMGSLSFYYTSHELVHLDKELYGVKNFNDLSPEPTPTRSYEYRGQTRHEYELSRIAGTVLDKDKNRHTVTILTTDGVVTVKLFRNSYSYLDRQISKVGSDGKKTVIERSWLTRGNLLLLTGFRRGNQFVPRTFRNSVYQHSIMKINSIDENGKLSLSTSRKQI